MSDWRQQLELGLSELRVRPRARHRQLLEYLTLLDHWNATINLTGLTPEARVRRLVLEPLWVAIQLRPSGHYLDIGSGNGSPGIPWSILVEFTSTSLVESRGRRATFLEVVTRRVGLEALDVYAARFESIRDRVPAPDWVSLQGVRLGAELLDSVRRLNSDVTVVWFTSNPTLPEAPSFRMAIPDSDREAVVFASRTGPPLDSRDLRMV